MSEIDLDKVLEDNISGPKSFEDDNGKAVAHNPTHLVEAINEIKKSKNSKKKNFGLVFRKIRFLS